MTTTSRSERKGFDSEGIEDSEYVNILRGGVRSTRTKRIAVSLAVVIMMVLVSATVMISSSANEESPETAATAAIIDDYVCVGMVSPVVNWNPLTVAMVEDYMMSSLIYSSLFTYDENWGGPVMDLATGWAYFIDSNNSMITFIDITHNAYFRSLDNLSGTDHQLSAEDVEFTFNLIKSGSGNAYGMYFEDITVLGTANQSGTGYFQDQIVLQTPYPKATLIDDIASVPILPKYIWETYSSPFTALPPTELVGSGPFVFEDYLIDAWYKFKKAPNYHGETDYGDERSIKFDGIVYDLSTNEGELVIRMNSGELDVISLTGEIGLFNDILGDGASVPITKQAVQELGICDIALNAIPYDFRFDLPGTGGDWGITSSLGNPHLQDPEVRKAILMTLDRSYICEVILRGLAVEADSVLPPGFWQADIDGVLPFNISGARDVLLAAGYYDDGGMYLKAGPHSYVVQNGLVGPGAELAHIRCHAPNTDASYGAIAFAWEGWAEDAGIGLDSEVVQEAIMVNEDWYKADYDIWVWHWGWSPEPISDLSIWLTEEMTSGGTNCQMPMGEWWYGWSNYTQAPSVWSGLGETIEYTPTGPYSSFDQNISIAMKTLNPMERKAILDDLQQVIYDSYCESPPFYDLGLYGYTDCRFTNWGDFTAHPGRAFTSGLCWLWFDLEPVGYNQMPVFTTPPLPFYEVEVGEPITFVFGFIDPDGDPIGVNWSFGDGEYGSQYICGDTTVETLVSVTHTYAEEATNLTLTTTLNDIPFHTEYTVATSYVNVYPYVNQPPVIHFVFYDPPTAAVNQNVTWAIGVSDHEQGPDGLGLLVHIDWGDGTYSVHYCDQVANDTIVTITDSKSWTEAGTHTVRIDVSDFQTSALITIPYTVAYSPNDSEVNYQWHDMFGHEFGSWMEYRESVGNNEWVITDSYPYIGLRGSLPIGNTDIYTFMQLDIDGQAIPELNMNDNPQFLPLFGDANGGTAEIDWYMNYITEEEGIEKLPPAMIWWFDGWFIALNGTVSLDEQAAMAVLGITSEQFDDFDAWWAANGSGVKADWHDWLLYEGNERLDIYAMYEYPLTFAYFEMDAVKSGSDEVIIYMDTISWGMEALMTRWLRDAFMPTEWYMEDMDFHAVIGPESADLDIDAAVAYSVFAYESVIDGEPCWAWQAMMQDRVFSFSDHPSLLDPYIGLELLERSPSSAYNGDMLPYDFTPGAWDLSANETLSFEWPDGEVLFFIRDEGNETGLVPDTSEFWSEMTVRYLEPDASDAPEGVCVDPENRTITFEGPFDMRTWSEEQTEHEWLADEWDRLGVLPYGVPYIEFCPADSTANHAPNASFVVTPESGPVGTVFTFNASSSFDVEDPVELLKVQWDWNGDGIWDTALSTEKVAVHQYMTEGNYTVFLKVVDTDGLVGQTVRTVYVYAPAPLSATVDIDKDRVNIAGRGGWITAYIELPEGYDVADINLTTVCLEGALFADPATWSIGDYDLDGIPDLAVRFDRANLSYVLEVGDEVTVTVSGVLADGTPFEGVDVIEVVSPRTSAVIIAAILDVTLSSVSPAALMAVLIALAAIGVAALHHHRLRSGRVRGARSG